jgi:hypothetical protein
MCAGAPDDNNAKDRPVWIKKVIDYVISRQNDDGGYTFCQGTESNLQDTYYGLAILDLLHHPFPNVERTIYWLRNFEVDNIYSCYYVAKALELCGKKLDEHLINLIISFIDAQDMGENLSTPLTDAYLGTTSEFMTTFIISELSKILKLEPNGRRTASWLLSFLNRDGGFGANRCSNVVSTYHAVASLNNLRYNVKNLRETIAYVRSCEKPSGGFAIVPQAPTPYMEYTYCGMMSLDLFGKKCRFPTRVAEFVFKCQNLSGGFGRSDFSISTFENTFQAISILKKLGKIQ